MLEYWDLFRAKINRRVEGEGESKLLLGERESFKELVRQQLQIQRGLAEVNTLYKKVGEKVKPVDTLQKDLQIELERED
jgi:hypothetical protein